MPRRRLIDPTTRRTNVIASSRRQIITDSVSPDPCCCDPSQCGDCDLPAEDECEHCTDCTPAPAILTLAGWTVATCLVCAGDGYTVTGTLDGDYTLTNLLGGCVWTSGTGPSLTVKWYPGDPTCAGAPFSTSGMNAITLTRTATAFQLKCISGLFGFLLLSACATTSVCGEPFDMDSDVASPSCSDTPCSGGGATTILAGAGTASIRWCD